MIDALEARLAPDASMLVLVGEASTLDGFVSAVGAALSSEQAKELSEAAK